MSARLSRARETQPPLAVKESFVDHHNLRMLKLKKLLQRLQGETPPPEVTLDASYSDADQEMDAFLKSLFDCGVVRSVSFSTDFLMCMEDETVIKFLTALGDLSSLEELSIKSSSRFHIESIPAHGLLPLRKATHLRKLEFQDMQVTAEHQAFLHALAKTLERHSSLQVVKAQNLFANDHTNASPDILDPLLISLSTMPALVDLELTGCGSHALSGQVVPLLSTSALKSLLSHPKLETLELSFLELSDDSFAQLVPELSANSSLTTLALDYHNLQCPGFKSMMKAMEENVTIKSLSLRSLRDIGPDGFAQAMRMLQLNYTVETLSVTTSPSQQAEINLYLRMNAAGRRLLRAHKVSASEWIEILARHSDDIDLVRHLLSEVPVLFQSGGAATMGEHDHDDDDDGATAADADDLAPSSSTTSTKVGALACDGNALHHCRSQKNLGNSTNDSGGLASS